MGVFYFYPDGVTPEDIISGKAKPTHEVHNHLHAGKIMALNFMFNSTSWLTGAGWYANRFIGAGTSTNTNAGVNGPTEITYTSVTGTWQGADEEDYKLTNEITISRPQITSVRAGKTEYLIGTFNDDNFTDGGTTNYDLVEFGFFISGEVGYPNANPITSADIRDKNNCMLIRAVQYQTSGENYIPEPITKTAGTPKTFRYVFTDFEGE